MPADNSTKPRQFRLADEVLAKLDALIAYFAADSGEPETRTSVLRQLVHREYARRKKLEKTSK